MSDEQPSKKARTGEDSPNAGASGLVMPPPRPYSYYLALDIEHTGGPLTDPKRVLMIGLCFGRVDGTVLLQRAFCWPVPKPAEFDRKTWEEFWLKYPNVIARIDEEAKKTQTPLADFLECLMDLEKKYGPFGKDAPSTIMRYVSDNPGGDIGSINTAIYQLARGIATIRDVKAVSERLVKDAPSDVYNEMLVNKALEPLLEGVPAEASQPRAQEILAKQGARVLNEMFARYVPTDDPTERERAMTNEEKAHVATYIQAPHSHWAVDDATQIFQRACGVASVLGE